MWSMSAIERSSIVQESVGHSTWTKALFQTTAECYTPELHPTFSTSNDRVFLSIAMNPQTEPLDLPDATQNVLS